MVMIMLSALFATSDMAETKTKPKKFVINHKTFCRGEDMAAIKTLPASTQGERSSIENCIGSCKDKFNQMLSEVLNAKDQEAHQVEASIFKRLMELGLLLLTVFFANQNQGDYGETVTTVKGVGKRGRVSGRAYFSIFGKLKVYRYLYHIGNECFVPLDVILNLPVRCYSYYLSEVVNLLDINGAYLEGVKLLEKFFGLKLSVSAVETISSESAKGYEDYYDLKHTLPNAGRKEDFTVVSFDGKGVPMIKEEGAKIKGRQGKGEKKQKKKEALVGVKYTVNANVRTPEEVADNLVYPDKKKQGKKPKPVERAQDIRYIASVEKPKREVMEEIKQEVKNGDFNKAPLVCVMDGAKHLWDLFIEIFKEINNKVLILDIIHVLEYIWLIAHIKYKEGSDEGKRYVYEKLLLILQGKVASYILELQNEMLSGSWKKSQQETFLKVITYFKNHKQYMKYDQCLSQGYPIGSGVVESACSHVVKDRMEITGARWRICGAEPILRLRSVVKSNDWDAYWQFYTTQSQNNDFSPIGVNSLNLQQKIAA
jgi:hypothetical protein